MYLEYLDVFRYLEAALLIAIKFLSTSHCYFYILIYREYFYSVK